MIGARAHVAHNPAVLRRVLLRGVLLAAAAVAVVLLSSGSASADDQLDGLSSTVPDVVGASGPLPDATRPPGTAPGGLPVASLVKVAHRTARPPTHPLVRAGATSPRLGLLRRHVRDLGDTLTRATSTVVGAVSAVSESVDRLAPPPAGPATESLVPAAAAVAATGPQRVASPAPWAKEPVTPRAPVGPQAAGGDVRVAAAVADVGQVPSRGRSRGPSMPSAPAPAPASGAAWASVGGCAPVAGLCSDVFARAADAAPLDSSVHDERRPLELAQSPSVSPD